MSATISEVKTALATKLGTISGMRAYAYQPDSPAFPCAIPTLTDISYHGAMGAGLVTYSFTVSIIVGRVSERSSESKLNEFASYSGASSVRQVLELDGSLGNVVDATIVNNATNISSISLNDADYLMIDFSVTVYDS